jgi:predicted permease
VARLLQDLRFGLRSFGKARGFTALAVLVLGLGIGVNTAIFTLVNAMLLQPLSGRAGDLVGVYSRDRTKPDSYRPFSYPNYVDIRDRSGLFDGLMAHTFAMVGEPDGDRMKRTFVAVVSSNYFDTLGVHLAAGRTFTSEEERPGSRIPVVVAGYPRWKRANLDPAFVGHTLRINNEDFTVVGVAPEGFSGTMALVGPDLFLPLGMFDAVVNDVFKNKGTGLADRSNAGLILAGRLKPLLTQPVVDARLDALSRQLEAAYPAENKDQALSVSPLPRLSTSTAPQTDGALGAFSGLLLALSASVLLIACLNLANMLLARGSVRAREIAVRLALGASRGRVVRQLVTESLALAVAGGALGLLLAYWAVRLLARSLTVMLPMALNFSPRPNMAVLGATLGFAVISTLLFGLGPALRLSRRDLVTDLKALGSNRSPGRRFGARNLMVVGQMALSLALLTAGGLFARTAVGAASIDPGYRYDRLLLASVDPSLASFNEPRGRAAYARVLERLRGLAGVAHVGMASSVPFGNFHEGERVERVGGKPSNHPYGPTYRIITADYFASLGLQVLRGREFSRAEENSPAAPAVAIVDEALARRLFGNADPVGQMIRFIPRDEDDDPLKKVPMQIVGVAPPILEELVDRKPAEHIYVPSGRFYRANMNIHVRLSEGVSDTGMLNTIRREIGNVEARLPVLELTTMRGFHERSLELWALTAGTRMFAGMGFLALVLAMVGVYGVKSYVVSQRTREIGIRLALGAGRADVLRLVLGEGIALTSAGIAVGIPLAAFVSIAFTKVFVEIGGLDATVIGIAAGLLAASAMAASFLPARRATQVRPTVALRAE